MTTTDKNNSSDTPEIASVPQVEEMLSYPDTYILDVRRPEEILGTGYLRTPQHHVWTNLPCSRTEAPLLEMTMDRLFPSRNTPILVYCRSGKRAVMAQNVLQKGGYARVLNAGGWSDVQPFVAKDENL